MNNFKYQVIRITKQIPSGQVMSYGQIAALAGSPRAARMVGGILNRCSEQFQLPWWRVVNRDGHLTIRGSIYSPHTQRQLLLAEGIQFHADFQLAIERYRHHISTTDSIFKNLIHEPD
jgi:methylated-DNA-protein-cysteine methyltransferase-like protein